MLARYNLRGQEASDSSDAFFFVSKEETAILTGKNQVQKRGLRVGLD